MHDIRLQELRLYTDYGRCCRPLFIVDPASQRLRIRKSDIRQLQDAEDVAFGWQVGGSASLLIVEELKCVCAVGGVHWVKGPISSAILQMSLLACRLPHDTAMGRCLAWSGWHDRECLQRPAGRSVIER